MDLESKLEEIYTDDAQLTRISAEIGQSILKKETTLIELVEALGPKLTHKDSVERGRAMNILSVVFNTLSIQDFLSEKELTFIVEFLHDRLRDQHLIIPKVIHCIRSIIGCSNLPEGAAGKLLLQLFKEANIQSHIHKDRHAFFLILASVLEGRIKEIQSWGSDFFMYFIQSIDGEKDPRNLLLIFQLVPISLNNLPLGPFVEELFEVLSCYFPVDFTPIKTDVNEQAITRDSLASALNACLSQTNLFAPLLIPLIVEKLDSTLTSSKIDSLKLLEMCCKTSYLPEDLEPFLPSIWRLLRKEIFMGGNESVSTQACSLITTAFAMLSQSPKVLEKAITMIFTECRSHLMEPELRLMVSSSSVLIAIAEASDSACSFLMSLLLPLLYDQFLKKTAVTERQNILTFLVRLVSVTRRFPSVNLMEIISNWDEIMATMFNLISHSDPVFVNLSLEFFTLILPTLDSPSLDMLQQHLLNLLSIDAALPSEDTKSRLLSCLEFAAFSFPNDVNRMTIQILLERIENLKNSKSVDKFDLTLSAIAECSFILPIARIVVPFLLENIRQSLAPASLQGDNNNNLRRLLSYLKCYNRILLKGCDSGGTEFKRSRDDVFAFCEYLCVSVQSLDVLVQVVKVARSSSTLGNSGVEERELIYQAANEAIRKLLRSSDAKVQTTIVDSFWNQPLEKHQGSVELSLRETPGLLIESILGSMRRSVQIQGKPALLEELLNLVLAPSSNDTQVSIEGVFQDIDSQALIRLFANLVNKLESDDDLNNLEVKMGTLVKKFFGEDIPEQKSTESEVKEIHENSNQVVVAMESGDGLQNGSSGNSENFPDLFLWFLKALAMRGAKCVDNWVEKCVQLVGVSSMGHTIAEKFSILMEDCQFTVNVESHCNYRFLYKQRVFLTSVPKLVKAYKESPPDHPTRVSYIRTLSCLLLHVPRTVLHMELDSVLPLLIASLTCETSSGAVRLSSLKALDDLLTSSESEKGPRAPLTEYFHDIVPYLVKLTAYQPDMHVRVLALKCLQKCAKYPVHMVLQEKQLVTDHLKLALDDPKRLVRKEAVSTRNIWILTGAPGGL